MGGGTDSAFDLRINLGEVVAAIPRHRSPKFMCELGHDDARIAAPFDEGSRKTFAQFVEAAPLPPRSGCSQRAPHRFMDK